MGGAKEQIQEGEREESCFHTSLMLGSDKLEVRVLRLKMFYFLIYKEKEMCIVFLFVKFMNSDKGNVRKIKVLFLVIFEIMKKTLFNL